MSIMHIFSPDGKLAKFASAYIIAARSPATTRSVQCLTILSIAGLASNTIRKTVTHHAHGPCFDTEKNFLDSGFFNKQQVPTCQPDAARGTVVAGREATSASKGPLLQLETSNVAGCVSLALA